jgi:hypothetical protein
MWYIFVAKLAKEVYNLAYKELSGVCGVLRLKP